MLAGVPSHPDNPEQQNWQCSAEGPGQVSLHLPATQWRGSWGSSEGQGLSQGPAAQAGAGDEPRLLGICAILTVGEWTGHRPESQAGDYSKSTSQPRIPLRVQWPQRLRGELRMPRGRVYVISSGYWEPAQSLEQDRAGTTPNPFCERGPLGWPRGGRLKARR